MSCRTVTHRSMSEDSCVCRPAFSTLPASNRKGKIPPKANCLAKALFDNIAESPDELAFRRSDILTVLEQNTNGLEGWWLCSLRGRQGIVPGNRLRLLAGMYEDPLSGNTVGTFPGRGNSNNQNKHARRRSWHNNPNKVITPQKVGDVYLYDVPKADTSSPRLEQSTSLDAYDVPPFVNHRSPQRNYRTDGSNSSVNNPVTYDMPPDAFPSSAYDVPRTYHAYNVPAKEDTEYDTPTSNRYVGDPKQVHSYDVPDSGDFSYDVPISHLKIANDKSLDYDVPPTRTFGSAYNVPQSPQSLSKRCSGMSLNSTGSSAASSSSGSGVSTVQQVLTSPTHLGCRSSLEQPHELYDVPSSETRKVMAVDKNIGAMINVQQELYDVPTNNSPAAATVQLQPQTKLSDAVYDVPPQVTRDVSFSKKDDAMTQRLSSSSLDSVTIIEGKELPLELDAAMDTLVRIQQQVHAASTKLFSHITTSWKKKENLDAKFYDIKQTCTQVRTVLQEFVNFAQGALVNSTHATDKSLSKKLAKLVRPLIESNVIIQNAGKALEDCGWQLYKKDDPINKGTPDELDQFVACTRSVNDDVRHVASFIQGNCTLLFKRSEVISPETMKTKPKVLPKPASLRKKPNVQNRPLPEPPTVKETFVPPSDHQNKEEWMNEYDYVSMESKESFEKENKEIKDSLPREMEKSFDNLVRESQVPVEDVSTIESEIDCGQLMDRQVLEFYLEQVDKHMQYLTNAIDAFLMTVENNQPPKIFVAHTKFIVLAAHKLVYVGDNMHRSIENIVLRQSLSTCTNGLCDMLKHVVVCTKTAAAQFPSVTAVQSMIDSVVDVSHVTNDLKLIINQSVATS